MWPAGDVTPGEGRRLYRCSSRLFDAGVLAVPLPNSNSAPTAESSLIAGSVLPIQRAEELLATLPGVMSARIVASPNGAVDEIHILTTTEFTPKQTVRNVESALIAHLGMHVSHKKISVATSDDGQKISRNGSASTASTASTAATSPMALRRCRSRRRSRHRPFCPMPREPSRNRQLTRWPRSTAGGSISRTLKSGVPARAE